MLFEFETICRRIDITMNRENQAGKQYCFFNNGNLVQYQMMIEHQLDRLAQIPVDRNDLIEFKDFENEVINNFLSGRIDGINRGQETTFHKAPISLSPMIKTAFINSIK